MQQSEGAQAVVDGNHHHVQRGSQPTAVVYGALVGPAEVCAAVNPDHHWARRRVRSWGPNVEVETAFFVPQFREPARRRCERVRVLRRYGAVHRAVAGAGPGPHTCRG